MAPRTFRRTQFTSPTIFTRVGTPRTRTIPESTDTVVYIRFEAQYTPRSLVFTIERRNFKLRLIPDPGALYPVYICDIPLVFGVPSLYFSEFSAQVPAVHTPPPLLSRPHCNVDVDMY